jgi:hypothetical protein
MRVALICPANKLYMPYMYNYTDILDAIGINYFIINWDRFGIEEQNILTYRDNKVGHKRSLLDYYKYCRFISTLLNGHSHDKVIVFGIQLSFLLQRLLLKRYRLNYILDIRDYNRVIDYFDFVVGVK